MADVVSNRSVLLLAAVCLCIGSIGIGTTASYVGLIIFMGVTGIGLGAIELGANGLMVELHSDARGRYLNLLSTCHGFGSLLVPLYAASLIGLGSTWRQIYCSSVLLAIPLLVLFRPRSPWAVAASTMQPETSPALSAREPWDWSGLARSGFTRRMNCFYALIAAYVAVELSVAAWLMEFLQQERGMSVAASSFCLSSFFTLLMLGRLLGAFVVERVDYTLAVFVALVATSFCLLGGIFGSDALVFLLPLSGLSMSIVFPTVTAAVTRLHVSKTGTILGILFACGGAGGALGPWVVGFVSETAGLTVGLASSLAFALIAVIALLCLRHQGAQDQVAASGVDGIAT
jgi:fucose permease